MNDGSAEKPYFMSDSLKGILDLQNRPPTEGNDEGRKWANGLHPKNFSTFLIFLSFLITTIWKQQSRIYFLDFMYLTKLSFMESWCD